MTDEATDGYRFQVAAGAVWLFAYGSLIFRPGFTPERAVSAELRGFARRFWQGSPDHRGTPERPGRVVTLVDLPGECCQGIAYLVPASGVERILSELDVREQAGFVRQSVELQAHGVGTLPAMTYVARRDNPHFLGPLPPAELAREIAERHGPSGSNAEYLQRLARALRERGLHDAHVFELERELGLRLGAT